MFVGTLRKWDIEGPRAGSTIQLYEAAQAIEGCCLWCVCAAPQVRAIFAGCENGRALQWDINSGEFVQVHRTVCLLPQSLYTFGFQPHTHTLAITCTCCYDVINESQDLKTFSC